MTSLLVRHRVSNFTEWHRRFATQEAIRRADGELSERIFRNALDPREVLVLYEWDDLDRALLFCESDDFHENIPCTDLDDQPDLWFLQETDPADQSSPQTPASSVVTPKEE